MNYLLFPSAISSPPQPASPIANDDPHEVPQSSISHIGGAHTLVYKSDIDTTTSTLLDHGTTINSYVGERICDYYIRLCSFDVDQHACALTETAACVQHPSSCPSPSPSTLTVHVDTENHDRMVLESSVPNGEAEHEQAHEINSVTMPGHDDVLSLSDHVHELGVGQLPPHEVPQKPSTSTPEDRRKNISRCGNSFSQHWHHCCTTMNASQVSVVMKVASFTFLYGRKTNSMCTRDNTPLHSHWKRQWMDYWRNGSSKAELWR